LEFYVSIYVDEYSLTTNLFINEINKLRENGPYQLNSFEFNEVGFISYNTLGVFDFYAFTFENIKFDKVIDFDGYLVVKFKSTVGVNGECLYEQYRESELDVKYDNKEQKKVTI